MQQWRVQRGSRHLLVGDPETPDLSSAPIPIHLPLGVVSKLLVTANGCRTLHAEIKRLKEAGENSRLSSLGTAVLKAGGWGGESQMKNCPMYCPKASYVLQDLLAVLPPEHPLCWGLMHAILSRPPDEVALHVFGSGVLLALLASSACETDKRSDHKWSHNPKKKVEQLLGHLAPKAAQLAADLNGARLLCFSLAQFPSSKILLPVLTPVAADLARNRWGYRVIQAALGRASSQALGMLEGVIRENLDLLFTHEFGARVVAHILAKEKGGRTASAHAQARLYCSIIFEWSIGELVSVVNDYVGAEMMTELLKVAEGSENRDKLVNRIFHDIPLPTLVHAQPGIDFFAKVFGSLPAATQRILADQIN